MEALVRGLFTAVMSVIGLVYFFCWSPRLRLLGLCHILLFSTAAACCSLYHFTANNVYVDKEWPNTFTTAFDTCFLVAQVWAILLRFALPCHAGSNCKLFGKSKLFSRLVDIFLNLGFANRSVCSCHISSFVSSCGEGRRAALLELDYYIAVVGSHHIGPMGCYRQRECFS